MAMNVSAEALQELHHLHRLAAALQERLDHGPKQIKTKEHTVVQLDEDLQAAREREKQARMAVDKKQLQLKTGESKILDLRNKLNTCSSNREYQLLLEQIAADEMANSVMEDEIIEALDRIEALKGAVGIAEQNLEKGKQELARVQQAVAAETAGVEADLARVQGELQVAESKLPAEFRTDYNRLVKHRGAEAMAGVEDNVCQGCYQKVTPNMQAELSMRRVVPCRGCGRLLYVE